MALKPPLSPPRRGTASGTLLPAPTGPATPPSGVMAIPVPVPTPFQGVQGANRTTPGMAPARFLPGEVPGRVALVPQDDDSWVDPVTNDSSEDGATRMRPELQAGAQQAESAEPDDKTKLFFRRDEQTDATRMIQSQRLATPLPAAGRPAHAPQPTQEESSADTESTASRRLEPRQGVVIAEKYRLDKVLKRGGMGSVWVGTHLSLDIPVAVKFMSASLVLPPMALSRFKREAKIAAQIRSSNVVQIMDHGVDRGLPYIVMELLEGEDLSTRLKRDGRMSMDDVSRIVTPIARALERAHTAGLVHRDLKPQNIFISREGDIEIPKILDFGIAKTSGVAEAAGDNTRVGTLLGTPYYMSPEQAKATENIDHRSDLWSLGVIMFRMLSGAKPFSKGGVGDVLVQICTGVIPKATSIAPDLPAYVDDFFARALARDPAERFQSAREMAQTFSGICPSGTPFDSAADATGKSTVPSRALPTMPGVRARGDHTQTHTLSTQLSALTRINLSAKQSWIFGLGFGVVVGGAAGIVYLLKPSAAPSAPETAVAVAPPPAPVPPPVVVAAPPPVAAALPPAVVSIPEPAPAPPDDIVLDSPAPESAKAAAPVALPPTKKVAAAAPAPVKATKAVAPAPPPPADAGKKKRSIGY